MQFYQTIKSYYLALVAIVILAMTAQTAWAQDTPWPSYITNVVLVGGTEQEAQNAKSGYSGYTWCSTSLNYGTGGETIYIGYKTSNSADTDGDYITDFIVVDAVDHNPPSSVYCNGHTYYLCPAAGGDYFANTNKGNLTSRATSGWNIYLYYTKANFSDKRAVSSINITIGEDTKSGSIDCYKKDGSLLEENISLNRNVKNTPFVFMHISTETKVNRPNPAPKSYINLTYNGSPKNLFSTSYTNQNSGTVYYRLGDTGSYTTDVSSLKATKAGSYRVWYYSGASDYGNSSVDYAHLRNVTIAKSPNSGATVTCADALESAGPSPSITGTNLSTGAKTYKYSTSQNGSYSTTVPTTAGTYWVKATIAADNNCNEYTTAAVSFKLKYDWGAHNSGNSENDAYVISTTEDLNLLSERVNSGINDYAGKFFKLGANITLNKNTTNNFTPIGNSSHSFKGTFDGKGYTISGLNINKPSNDYIGLFGYANGATIKGVKLDNSTIGGKQYVGGILGSGNYSNTIVENCLVTNGVDLNGQSDAIGGIVGTTAIVRGCVSAATVSGSGSIGGIIGNGNKSTVTNCLYTGSSITGDIRGAIVGYKSSGNFTANYYTQATIGGCNGSDTDGARKTVVINAADGVTVTPTGDATAHNVSGITGYAGNSGIKYTVGNSTVTYAGATETVSLDIAYNIEGFNVTGYNDGNGNALTHVSGNTYTLTMTANAPTVTPVGSDVWGITTDGRDGSAEHPYLITTTEGLDLLAKKVNGIDGYSANTYSDKYFELGNDITYSYASLGNGESNYTAIGTKDHNFMGKFDGKGHTISGIRINANADNQGLFGYIHYAEVKNLTIDDTHITIGSANKCAGAITGYSNVGNLIENCHITNSVIVSGGDDIGGIVGDMECIVRGCTSAATVSGNNRVGGLVGYLVDDDIENCLVLGATISGNENVGVLAGEVYYGGYENSYYIGTSVNGATGSIAYELLVATYAMGTKGTTYAADTDYEGITAYENGLAYSGKFYSPSPWGGRGTEYDPYVIYNTAGMDKLANEVNGGNEYKYTYFVLGADITYDKTVENNYTTIGDNLHSFAGTFDGQGHTISGIRISDTEGSNKAIFGHVRGTVKNLVVSDCSMEAYQNIGGIVAYLQGGTIENCHVLSDVTLSGNAYIGGIAAENDGGTVKGCTSAATIIGTEDNGSNAGWLGGIAGSSGENHSTLTDNLFTGTISGNLLDYIGAILGKNDYNETTLTNNHHTLSGKGGVGSGGSAIGSDEDGAFLAVSSTTKPSGFGEATATYGKDDYIGITAYQYGLCYNGQYYEKDPNVVIWSGKGTEEKPYVIRTTAELDLLATNVNGGNIYLRKYFVLGADITYDKTKENNYIPIGDYHHSFYGTFDGKGHKVSGIRISDTNSVTGQNKAIFGMVDGTVKNLIVSDCRMEAYQNIGGIVSYLQGTIENCHVDSDVTLSGNSYIGGIAAQNEEGTIIGCTSAATIRGTKDSGLNAAWLGGIVGSVSGTGCTTTLTDNLFTGTISGLLRDYIGAIVGKNNRDETILNNNYHTCSGMGGVGNEDDATSSDVDGATIAYELPEANAAMGAPGSTYAAGTDYEGITVFDNGLAYNGQFYSQDPWGGYGTEEDPYVIYTTEGLDLLAKKVNGTDGYTANTFAGTYFELGADIAYDESVDNNYTPIGDSSHSFSGTFDGQGHTVSGIRISDPDGSNKAIFGRIAGTVKNLKLDNSTITGRQKIGGIVRLLLGTIENCHVGSDVILTGNSSIGGIAAENDGGTIKGCTSAATIIGTEYLGLKAIYLGGIAGYSSFLVHTPTLTDNLFTGTISGDLRKFIGAIVGENNSNAATLTNNYHTSSDMRGVGNDAEATGTDTGGAKFAYELLAANGAMGEPGSTYAEGEVYEGITVYENGLAYDGKYYSQDPWGGNGTEEDPYIIYTPEGLDQLASRVNSGNDYDGKYFALGADITYDKTKENNYTPIGNGSFFYGTFDGQRHIISGIRISDPYSSNNAIFGMVERTVKNLVVSDCRFEANQIIGGIVAYLRGTIENCHVLSDVTLSGNSYVGGIVAQNDGGTIKGCTSAATITGIEDGWNAKYHGGIVSSIPYSEGTPVLTDNLFTGTISGNLGEYIGAIVGMNNCDKTILNNNYHTLSGVGGCDGSDVYGAQFAVSSTTPPASIDPYGKPTAVYSYTVGSDKIIGITAYSPNGLLYKKRYYWHEDLMDIPLIDDRIDNDYTIAENNGKIVNVRLAGRTFRKDGKWSTIVLPFDVDLTAPDSPLQGAIIRTLTNKNINNVISGTTLNLTFDEKWDEYDEANTLMAGVSYLIRWDRPDDYEGNESMYDIVDPLFIGVKIKDKHLPCWSYDGLVNFEGNYNCMGDVVSCYPEEFDVLLLGDDNNLHYATPGESLGACRACFVIHRDQIGENFRLTNYIFDLGNGEMLSGTFPSIVQPVQPGDANGDGNISVTDIAVVVNCILQLDNNGGFSPDGADANGDGQITVTDIGVIVDKILGVNNNSGNAGARRLTHDAVEPQ